MQSVVNFIFSADFAGTRLELNANTPRSFDQLIIFPAVAFQKRLTLIVLSGCIKDWFQISNFKYLYINCQNESREHLTLLFNNFLERNPTPAKIQDGSDARVSAIDIENGILYELFNTRVEYDAWSCRHKYL